MANTDNKFKTEMKNEDGLVKHQTGYKVFDKMHFIYLPGISIGNMNCTGVQNWPTAQYSVTIEFNICVHSFHEQ